MRPLRVVLSYIEIALGVVLLVLIFAGLCRLLVELVGGVAAGTLFTGELLTDMLERVLLVFVFIELFQIMDAYIQRQRVVRSVLEAALVVVARKLVIFETHAETLHGAIALVLLLLGVAVSWLLLQRAGALDDPPAATR